jgi:hypothetical protein
VFFTLVDDMQVGVQNTLGKLFSSKPKLPEEVTKPAAQH